LRASKENRIIYRSGEKALKDTVRVLSVGFHYHTGDLHVADAFYRIQLPLAIVQLT